MSIFNGFFNKYNPILLVVIWLQYWAVVGHHEVSPVVDVAWLHPGQR